MHKLLIGLLISLGFLVPAVASASATITQVTLNGGSSVVVDPGDNIVVSVTATLTDSTKWKGTGWGINQNTSTEWCSNTKNAKEGTRNNETGVFTETFIIKAPGQPGLYNANFLADEANNCGKPLGSTFTLFQAIRVGTNTVPPVISPHSDITIQLTAPGTGTTTTYINPTALDHFGTSLAVSCAPASGSFFAVGSTMVSCTAQDAWGNPADPSFFAVTVLAYIPPPPADSQAPVISAHADVMATTTGVSLIVSYTLPTALDNVDGSVLVTCSPASGSVFSLGTTTVTCSAHDTAGNNAASTFAVILTQVVEEISTLTPYVMASQPIESYLCGDNPNKSWRFCDTAGTIGFTDSLGSGIKTIDLGVGSSMGTGTIKTITIAKDPSEAYGNINLFHPWLITISCFTDAAHTISCVDWSQISDTAHNSGDGKYWNANFASLNRAFAQGEYYVMTIDDTGWETPAFGSQTLLKPYWEMVGLR